MREKRGGIGDMIRRTTEKCSGHQKTRIRFCDLNCGSYVFVSDSSLQQ